MKNFEGRKAKYEIEDGIFKIIPKKISNALLNKKELVIEYSNEDNKIVEVLDITEEFITTKYYPNWYPLVIIKPNKMFYSDDVVKDRSQKYYNLLMNSKRIKKLYNCITEAYLLFEDNLELTFGDKTSNNILVNEDITDFRIIDVNSIDESNNVGLLGSINAKNILGYFTRDYVVNDFLTEPFDEEFMDKFFESFNKSICILPEV